MKKGKFFIQIVLATLILMVVLFSWFEISQAVTDPAIPSTVKATVDDLRKAGFTGVYKIISSEGERFGGPVLYFEVGDKAGNSSSEASKVVMVHDSLAGAGAISYAYGTGSHAFMVDGFTLQGGHGKVGNLSDGRVVADFVKNGHYSVIIGPNEQKVKALVLLVADKIK